MAKAAISGGSKVPIRHQLVRAAEEPSDFWTGVKRTNTTWHHVILGHVPPPFGQSSTVFHHFCHVAVYHPPLGRVFALRYGVNVIGCFYCLPVEFIFVFGSNRFANLFGSLFSLSFNNNLG